MHRPSLSETLPCREEVFPSLEGSKGYPGALAPRKEFSCLYPT